MYSGGEQAVYLSSQLLTTYLYVRPGTVHQPITAILSYSQSVIVSLTQGYPQSSTVNPTSLMTCPRPYMLIRSRDTEKSVNWVSKLIPLLKNNCHFYAALLQVLSTNIFPRGIVKLANNREIVKFKKQTQNIFAAFF